MEEFIVSSVKETPNREEFCTIVGKAVIQAYSLAIAEPFDVVEVSGLSQDFRLKPSNITGRKADVSELDKVLSGLVSSIQCLRAA